MKGLFFWVQFHLLFQNTLSLKKIRKNTFLKKKIRKVFFLIRLSKITFPFPKQQVRSPPPQGKPSLSIIKHKPFPAIRKKHFLFPKKITKPPPTTRHIKPFKLEKKTFFFFKKDLSVPGKLTRRKHNGPQTQSFSKKSQQKGQKKKKVLPPPFPASQTFLFPITSKELKCSFFFFPQRIEFAHQKKPASHF